MATQDNVSLSQPNAVAFVSSPGRLGNKRSSEYRVQDPMAPDLVGTAGLRLASEPHNINQKRRITMDKPNRQPEAKANVTAIYFRDLGSTKKKLIRDLKCGKGELLEDVDDAIEEARASLPDSEKNKTLVPIVLVYREKRKKRRYDDLPFSPLNPFSLFRC